MNSKVNQNNASLNSAWFLLLGVSAVTIYFKIDAEDPFNTPKLLILVLVGAYLIGHLANYFRENGVWCNLEDKSLYTITLLFLLTMLIATLTTRPFLNGFIGETQRRNGFLSYFMLCVVFLAAYNFINFFVIHRLFIVAILTGLILSVYGIFQVNGQDFVQWVNPHNSMISTLGNPNFASAMLAVFAAISTFSIFLKILPFMIKVIGGLVTVFALYCIVESDSRQGLVTYFFAVLFYSALIAISKFKRLALPIIGLSIGVGALVILGMLQKGPLTYWLYKDSISVRGFYWRAGIEMLQNNWFAGVGMDRYGSFFKYFREVEYPLRYGYEISSSNAHNTVIQIFSTTGIFAGISYLLILFYVFYKGLSFIRSTDGINKLIVISLLSTWVGFQAQSFISIDNIGVSVWGWLISGAILGFIKSVKSRDQSSGTKKFSSSKVHINLFQPTISAVAVLIALLVVVPIYRSETDSYLVKSLGNNLTEQNKNAVYKYSSKVLNNNFADPSYKFRAALYMYDAGFQSESVSIIEDLSIKDPQNLDFLNGLAYLYTKNNQIKTAISKHEKIAQLDPWNAENYLTLGSLYVQENDDASAVKNFSKVISFAPNTEVASRAQEILNSLD